MTRVQSNQRSTKTAMECTLFPASSYSICHSPPKHQQQHHKKNRIKSYYAHQIAKVKEFNMSYEDPCTCKWPLNMIMVLDTLPSGYYISTPIKVRRREGGSSKGELGCVCCCTSPPPPSRTYIIHIPANAHIPPSSLFPFSPPPSFPLPPSTHHQTHTHILRSYSRPLSPSHTHHIHHLTQKHTLTILEESLLD